MSVFGFLTIWFVLTTFAKCQSQRDPSTEAEERIFVQKNQKNDLDSAATGYIYRSDGNAPPMFVSLGEGDPATAEDMFKNSGIHTPLKAPYTSYSGPSSSSIARGSDKSFTKPIVNSGVLKEAFKYIPSQNEDYTTFPAVNAGLLENYKEKDHEDYEFSKQISGHNFPKGGFSADDDITAKHGPVTYYKSNKAGYKQQSQMFINPGSHKLSHSTQSYVAPHFEAPSPDEVVFDEHVSPVKYPIQKLVDRSESYEHLPLVTEETEDVGGYAGEDTGLSGHYAHSGDYHHLKPEKYHYSKGGGESYDGGHHSAHGSKGEKGYKNYHDFDEGEMGHHGKEGKKGFYEQKAGHKKKHHDEADKYGEYHKGKHGQKGVKYGEAAGHKKGHKTTGYHNIFHKDEYKKEHKFYDDAHKHGYHDKHGGLHEQHGKKHGSKEGGGYYVAGYDEGHKGKYNKYKKGHYDKDHAGHKGEAGHESHYDNYNDYGKKSGHSEEDKHGYSEDGHGHYH